MISHHQHRPAVQRAVQTVLITLIFLGLGPIGTPMTSAQEVAKADFLPYSLQTSKAAEIESALNGLLPAGSEVVADPRNNRILVKGTSQAHQIAQNVIHTLDRGAEVTPTRPIAPLSPPILRTYRCEESQLVTLAEGLQQEFAGLPGVRIVPDRRTSLILAMAPAEVQGRIAARIGSASPQALTRAIPGAGNSSVSVVPITSVSSTLGASDAPVSASSPSAAGAMAPASQASPAGGRGWAQSPIVGAALREVQLRNRTCLELEAALAEALKNRLSKTGDATAARASYKVQLSGGGNLDLTVDRQASRVLVAGPAQAVGSCAQLIQALDSAPRPAGQTMSLLSLARTRSADVKKTVEAIQVGSSRAPGEAERPTTTVAQSAEPQPGLPQPGLPGQPAQPGQPGQAIQEPAGLVGPVQIEILEGLDMLVIRGNQRDVEQVRRIIEELEQLSTETQPAIEVYQLQHTDSTAMASLVTQVYSQVFSVRQGNVTIIALVKPNALLVIGRPESVTTAIDLVKRLDNPVPPESQFQVFRLRHAAAATAQETIQEFFDEREGGLAAQIRVTSDFRSNSLIVQGSPRDLAEVASMIEKLDTRDTEAVNELRVFKLSNTTSEELAPILQEAIAGQAAGGQAGAQASEQKSTSLRFITVDSQGKRLLNSGILTDVRITSDARSNALLVSAPPDSMPLIEALIKEMDQLPAAEAALKVFTIVNGDATSLIDMLETLFGQQTAAGQPAVRTGTQPGESSLVPLRFAVDARTNSIIASGSGGDLSVVEAILLRLDESDVRNRKSIVYRLKNSPATDVATAINTFLQSERTMQQQLAPDLISAFEQIEREVIVVPEAVSNSLIVSATPRFFEEISKIVEELDRRPSMVMIQVLIAEVRLNDFDEFGIELGLQDSLLFDRGVLSDIQYQSTTVTQPGQPQVTTQQVIAATNSPGFNFNNANPLGNSGATNALANAALLGTQGLSNFALGRSNSQLGFGGLVLSASNEAVSVLIRALQQCQRLEVLSRPQVMTLDNQPAFIQVGQRVPRITGTTTTEVGQTNSVTLENVGLILGVTPRISPEGLVVMEIDAEKSAVGPESEGVPVSISEGQVIRSPRIDTTTAQTTVSAMDGQTVILGGLLSRSQTVISRRVPWLSEIPVLGHLFRYDSKTIEKTELLIIMTPHIVDDVEDAEVLKQTEAARMHWCMSEVIALHGDINARGRKDEWSDQETKAIYPEAQSAPESVPAPPPAGPMDQSMIPTTVPAQTYAAPPGPASQGAAWPDAAGMPQMANFAPMGMGAEGAAGQLGSPAYDPIHRDPMWGQPSEYPVYGPPVANPAYQEPSAGPKEEPKSGLLQRLFAR